MMKEKEVNNKNEVKRLLIYLVFSFGLTWLIFFAAIFAGVKWDGSRTNMEQFIALGMLMPFAAHIITRFITREGFPMTGKDSVMLGISFKDKKWKYYLFALFIPWLYFEISEIIMLIIAPECFDTNIVNELGIDNMVAFLFPLYSIISCTIVSFAALGEEGGWRGYMMPKLINLMGLPKALIVGGVIWGLWHAPLTCIGHNFGTDYPGFPYLGIIIMCIYCTLMGIMLTYITIKTESIWPAAIMHAVNNGNPSTLKFFINTEVLESKYVSSVLFFILLMIPEIIIVAIIIIREHRKPKKHA